MSSQTVSGESSRKGARQNPETGGDDALGPRSVIPVCFGQIWPKRAGKPYNGKDPVHFGQIGENPETGRDDTLGEVSSQSIWANLAEKGQENPQTGRDDTPGEII